MELLSTCSHKLKNLVTMKPTFNFRFILLMRLALNIFINFSDAIKDIEKNQINASKMGEDSYLFIEVSHIINETTSPYCLNFSCFQDPWLIGLGYIFGGSELIAFHYLNLSEPTKVIVGSRSCFSHGLYGSCVYSSLYQVTGFPLFSGNLTILDIRNDIVDAAYQNQHFTLKQGESWINGTQEIIALKYGTVTITRDVIVENHGQINLVRKESQNLESCYGIWC